MRLLLAEDDLKLARALDKGLRRAGYGVDVAHDGDADHLRIVTACEGTLGPSAEPGVQHGSVIWRIEEGEGRFAGASGLITSNFTVLAESGEATEYQVATVFLP